MKITPVKTRSVRAGELSLHELLDESLESLSEGSVVAITSKIVSLCENNVLPLEGTEKEQLIIAESDQYLPSQLSRYGYHFSIRDHTLIAAAGIDESNGDGHYILWPADAQATANAARNHLQQHFNVQNIGVIITDSTCQPLRLGTIGIWLAHSGFEALHNYIKQPDIFGRPFGLTQSNIAGGLAAGAVVTMGEGAEQTPLAIIEDASFVTFRPDDPSDDELHSLKILLEDDLFAPFITAVDWKRGQHKSRKRP